VTLVREGAILIVDPQSRLVLPGTHVAGTASKVFQSSGRVLYQIESSRSGPFEVHAPSLIAGVKGTVFLVDVSTAESVVVVDRGLVGVTGRATREQVDVAAGKAAQLDRSGRLQRFEADEVDRGRRGQLARARELNQARDQAGWPQPERSGTPDPSTDHDADTDGEAEGEGPGQGHAWGRDRDEVGDPWGAAGEDGDASDHPGRGAGREEREAEDGSPGRRHGQSQGGGPPESGGDEDSSTGPGNASRGSGQGRGRGGSQ
jgi:hypothetical protein